jgi:mono/diheme cytochrome c family protein
MRSVISVVTGVLFAGCFPGPPGDDDDDPPTVPEDEVIVLPEDAPPPITGGTLAIARDGRTALVADPDRDLVWRIDLRDGFALSATELEPGDEPGRLVEDGSGLIHVALRRGGAIATIDPQFPDSARRTTVCPEPRGIAHDAAANELHVACTDGDLVTFDATDLVETRRLSLDADLRDVVVTDTGLAVSRFKTAEVLSINHDGEVVARATPEGTEVEDFDFGTITTFEPAVAWRMVRSPEGDLVVAHQRGRVDPIAVQEPSGYGGGGGCSNPIAHSAVTVFGQDGSVETSPRLSGSVLPVDVAVTSGNRTAVVSAGTFRVMELGSGIGDVIDDGCSGASTAMTNFGTSDGTPVAAAYARDEYGEPQLWVQTRAPANLVRVQVGAAFEPIELPGENTLHTGHESFHTAASMSRARVVTAVAGMAADAEFEFFAPADLACASCHPEGREDGRVWQFDIGPRRTQSVAGGILSTAPFHWSGDEEHLGAIMEDVFVGRMGGPRPSQRRTSALGVWIDSIPAPRAHRDADEEAARRGAALFVSSDVGCADCHNGGLFTNNSTVDVGTGERLQVPNLIGISARAPFLHDGSAPTLEDRFKPEIGGGDRHGHTSELTPDQIQDLVAYLESL